MGERTVGGFRILKKIKGGFGAQGTVYQAVCVEDSHGFGIQGRTVALKLMPIEEESGEQFRKLRKRTAELTKINHPNIVRYFGCFEVHDEYEDAFAIVQEFLDGETLKSRLSRNSSGLDVDEGLRIVKAAVAGLEYTSSHGIIHRDVKPGNIFLCLDGSVKLIDFEIAKQDGGTATASTGNIRGSFDYMAPDFTDPDFHGDVKSDVFSMGIVFHEVVTGRTPYGRRQECDRQFAFFSRWTGRGDGESPIQVSNRTNRLLSRADEVIIRATEPVRSLRYADFAEFRKGLSQIKYRDLKSGPNTYRMLRFIGKGGFGEVLKARWREEKKIVAVKHLLRSEYANRFRREAKVMKKLDDPCFVRFIDFFEIGGSGGRGAFLVMNFLDGMPGSSLRDAIRKCEGEALDERSVLIAFERYAKALAVMHAQGIYHRDIKPSNLYYPEGRPLESAIMDFGIVRDMNATVVTVDGNVPGTLDYMPPEIVRDSSRGDSGTDLFALGICFYEALTGKHCYPRLPPGNAQAWTEFIRRAKDLTPPNLDGGRELDPSLKGLIAEMVSPKASKRISDAATVARRIQKIRFSLYGEEENAAEDTETVGTQTIQTVQTSEEDSPQTEIAPTVVVEAPIIAPEGEEEPEAETADFAEADKPKSPPSFASRMITIVGTFVFTLAVVAGAAWFVFGERLLSLWRDPPKPPSPPPVTNIVSTVSQEDRQAARAIRHGKLIADLSDLVIETPVATRRERLNDANRLLVMDTAGEKLLTEEESNKYRDKVDTGKNRIVGEIKNEYRGKITVNGNDIPAGRTFVMSFDGGLPSDWMAHAEGRDAVPLPADFDGKTLVVNENIFAAAEKERRDREEKERIKKEEAERAKARKSLCDELDGLLAKGYSGIEDAKKLLENDLIGLKLLSEEDRKGYQNRIEGERKKEQTRIEDERKKEQARIEDERKKARKSLSDKLDSLLAKGYAGVEDAERLLKKDTIESKLLPEEDRKRYSYRIEEERNKEQDRINKKKEQAAAEAAAKQASEKRRRNREKLYKDFNGLFDGDLAGRRERLSKARKLLDDDRSGLKLLSDDERAICINRLEEQEERIIGVVRNDSGVEIVVNGKNLAPNAEHRFEFNDGRLPKEWTAKAEGYDAKQLSSDFDGKTISVGKLVESDVVATLPELEEGVMCYYENRPVRTALHLKPGSYAITYRRRGYVDQSDIKFKVYLNTPLVLPSPRMWQPNPVDVIVPEGLEQGIVCKLDGKPVSGVTQHNPGKCHYSYVWDDHKPQSGTFEIKPGVVNQVPSPGEWKRTEAYDSLVKAQEAVRNRKWEEAQSHLSSIRGGLSSNSERLQKDLTSKVKNQINLVLLAKDAEKNFALARDLEENSEETAGICYYSAVENWHSASEKGLELDNATLKKIDEACEKATLYYQLHIKNFNEQLRRGKNVSSNISETERKIKNIEVWQRNIKAKGYGL